MTADELLSVREHRTFPLPNSPWIMRQEWHDLLFAHWRVPTDTMRRLVPSQLELDLWNGEAYLGVVPFVIRNLRPRGVPSLPVLSNFPEINVRTYVKVNGISGVYFFSLDAANVSAVLAARFMYALPYFHAAFQIEHLGADVLYYSRRRQLPKPADFSGSYRPISDSHPWEPPDKSLERFVSERYCLYAISGGHVYRTVVHHLPWPLQDAAAEIKVNTMTAPLGIELQGPPGLLHYSKFMDVLVWYPERVT